MVGEELQLQRVGDLFGDACLNFQNIRCRAVVGLRPKVRLVANTDQLCGDAKALAGAPDAAFQDKFDAKLRANFRDVFLGAFVAHHRGAGNHTQFVGIGAAQPGDHFLGQTVSEVFVFDGDARKIVERKNGQARTLLLSRLDRFDPGLQGLPVLPPRVDL